MRQTIIFIVIAVIVIGAGAYLIRTGSGASGQNPDAATDPLGNINQPQQQAMDDLKIEDLTVGTGAEAMNGQVVTVNYVGTLDDGTKFDSSYDRGTPFSFTLGAGQVIPGWDLGVKGMKVGGKRRLTIPPALGYGASGVRGAIPPNATLHFDVELLKVGK